MTTAYAYTRAEFEQLLADEHLSEHAPTINDWLDRGDGAAVYENHDLGHPDVGHKQIVSYGSGRAQLEQDVPPERLPDIGGKIGWRYVLIGVYRAENGERL